MANWQRANPKKRGKPPEPMKWPHEIRAGAPTSSVEMRAQKQKVREEMARRQQRAQEAGLKSETIIYGE